MDNDLEGPLQVRINNEEYQGWDPQSGAVLWIQTSGIKAITEWPAAFLVEPASSRRIRLAEHFVATDPGFHPWRGYLDLPSSRVPTLVENNISHGNEGGFYRDQWGWLEPPHNSIFFFTVEGVTGVARDSWGRVKSEWP